jgi:hypothetical protein
MSTIIHEPTTTKPMVVRELAARYIAEYGFSPGAFARDSDGCPTDPLDPDAVEFCPDGACARALHELGLATTDDILTEACEFLFEQGVFKLEPGLPGSWGTVWADQPGRTADEVITLLLGEPAKARDHAAVAAQGA